MHCTRLIFLFFTNANKLSIKSKASQSILITDNYSSQLLRYYTIFTSYFLSSATMTCINKFFQDQESMPFDLQNTNSLMKLMKSLEKKTNHSKRK